jgi:hypothetical protein
MQILQGHQPRVQAVFQVVHRIRHVVGPVHDLRFQAGTARRRAGPDPVEHRDVRLVGAVLAGARAGDGILQGRVEGGAGEVEAGAGDLRFQPGEQPERLGVALETAARQRAAGVGERRQRRLPVVPERRVAEVVRQARRVHQVGVAAEGRAQLPADLRALQRMGQPGAREVTGPDLYHLRFRGEPAQR